MAARLEVTSLLSLCKVVLILKSLHLHEKSREVCIKTRSPLESIIAFIDEVTEHTTVKWLLRPQKDYM